MRKKVCLMLNHKKTFRVLPTKISVLICHVTEQWVIVGCTTIFSTYNNGLLF